MTVLEMQDAPSDGRRRRSADSRARIVAALLDLVGEGESSPSAEAVASRAQVGLRTVFRHFRDMESLYAEMAGHVEAEIGCVIAEPLQGSTWRERVMEVVERRAWVFERIAPYQRASAIHRRASPFLVEGHARLVAAAREVVARLVPTDAPDRQATLEAVDMMLSFEAWDRLRVEQKLGVEAARAVVELAVKRLLSAG